MIHLLILIIRNDLRIIFCELIFINQDTLIESISLAVYDGAVLFLFDLIIDQCTLSKIVKCFICLCHGLLLSQIAKVVEFAQFIVIQFFVLALDIEVDVTEKILNTSLIINLLSRIIYLSFAPFNQFVNMGTRIFIISIVQNR